VVLSAKGQKKPLSDTGMATEWQGDLLGFACGAGAETFTAGVNMLTIVDGERGSTS
jgi:hypothetical protein